MTEQERTDAIMNSMNETIDTLIFWTFRYFLSRQSIHASCFARYLARTVHMLSRNERAIMLKEITQEVDAHNEGRSFRAWPVDIYEQWRYVATVLKELEKGDDE